MNDPHVTKLHYKIEHSASVDYSAAEALERSERDFDARVEDEKVCFTMKRHYATEQEARDGVKDYIDAWEPEALLTHGPGRFALCFLEAEILDRNPPPRSDGIFVDAKPINFTFSVSQPEVTLGVPTYPMPPRRPLKVTEEVEAMRQRFRQYCLGRETLGGMAYFCLTVLTRQRGRKAAAKYFGICKDVLAKIGELSSTAGGDLARKAEGMASDWSQEERGFLKAAVGLLIRRIAEKAYDPQRAFPTITRKDLPVL